MQPEQTLRMRPRSPRLIWRRLAPEHADAFHRLVVDPHIRRYLLDGQVMSPAWCSAQIEGSEALFDRLGVGLWMLWPGDGMSDVTSDGIGGTNAIDDMPSGHAIGFAGYRIFDEMGPEPQLLYAFVEAVTGRGLASEAGRALLDVGRAAGLDPIVSAVDGPNRASLRVLAKLGFEVVRTTAEGEFGEMVYLERRG